MKAHGRLHGAVLARIMHALQEIRPKASNRSVVAPSRRRNSPSGIVQTIMRDVIMVALFTGARRSEIFDWIVSDYAHDCLRVRKSKTRAGRRLIPVAAHH
jgi:integrase